MSKISINLESRDKDNQTITVRLGEEGKDGEFIFREEGEGAVRIENSRSKDSFVFWPAGAGLPVDGFLEDCPLVRRLVAEKAFPPDDGPHSDAALAPYFMSFDAIRVVRGVGIMARCGALIATGGALAVSDSAPIACMLENRAYFTSALFVFGDRAACIVRQPDTSTLATEAAESEVAILSAEGAQAEALAALATRKFDSDFCELPLRRREGRIAKHLAALLRGEKKEDASPPDRPELRRSEDEDVGAKIAPPLPRVISPPPLAPPEGEAPAPPCNIDPENKAGGAATTGKTEPLYPKIRVEVLRTPDGGLLPPVEGEQPPAVEDPVPAAWPAEERRPKSECSYLGDGLISRGCGSPLRGPLAVVVAEPFLSPGSTVTVGRPQLKVWRVSNRSSAAWPASSRLAFVGGDNLTRSSLFSVTPLAPGQTCDLAVEVVARNCGRHVSNWQLVGPDNTPFGQGLVIDVHALPPTPPPGETSFSVSGPGRYPAGYGLRVPAGNSEAWGTDNGLLVEARGTNGWLCPLVEPKACAKVFSCEQNVAAVMKLRSMGFLNDDLNRAALAGSRGDVAAAVAWLLKYGRK